MKKSILVILSIFGLFMLAGVVNAQVPNGDFEGWTGSAANSWTADTAITQAQETTEKHGGTSSAKITWNDQDQAKCDYDSDFITGVTITGGSAYSINAWVFDNDAAGRVTIKFMWFDNDDVLPTTTYTNVYSADNASWQQLTASDAAPTTATKVKVGFRFYDVSASWDGDATNYLDDVTFAAAAGAVEAPISTVIQMDANGYTIHLGSVYKVRGIVTSFNLDPARLSFYIQDSTGGVLIDKASSMAWYGNKGLTIGSDVTIDNAIVKWYNGLVEIEPAAEGDITLNGTGTAPTPVQISINDLQDIASENQARFAMRGKLCRLSNIYKVTPIPTTETPAGNDWPASGANSNMYIAVGGATATPIAILRVDKDTDIDGNAEPTWPQNVIGIFNQFDSTSPYYEDWQILPRQFSDFSAYAEVGNWNLY